MASVPHQPPPATAPSARLRAAFTRFAEDQDEIQRQRQMASESVFFDKDSPSVRARRETTRGEFEWFVEAMTGMTEINVIWNSSTIIERTKIFMGGKLLKPSKFDNLNVLYCFYD